MCKWEERSGINPGGEEGVCGGTDFIEGWLDEKSYIGRQEV